MASCVGAREFAGSKYFHAQGQVWASSTNLPRPRGEPITRRANCFDFQQAAISGTRSKEPIWWWPKRFRAPPVLAPAASGVSARLRGGFCHSLNDFSAHFQAAKGIDGQHGDSFRACTCHLCRGIVGFNSIERRRQTAPLIGSGATDSQPEISSGSGRATAHTRTRRAAIKLIFPNLFPVSTGDC